MRKSLLLAGPILLAGCFHSKGPKAKSPGYEGVRQRAKEAHEGRDPGRKPPKAKAPPASSQWRAEEAAQTLGPAPEAEPKRAKEIGKDPAGCTWIESEAAVTVGEHDSRHQAHAAAVAQARQSAMQDFLGVDVKSRFMDFQQEGLRDQANLTESMLLTTRLGRILNERAVSEGYVDLPGCPGCRYHVVLQTCLMPIPDYADKDFHVELEVFPRSRFVEGDEARLRITSNRDCYVYLYDVYDTGKGVETALLIPNEVIPEGKLKAGETWEYPGEEHRKRGVRLMAELPEGKSISSETIRVIASKTPLSQKLRDPAQGGYLGVFRRLNASRIDWAEDAQAFTISRH